MNQDKYVFAQLTQFLDNNKFFRIVQKYNGDKGIRGFSYWNQMLMMIFGQLSGRDSLRDLMVAIQAHHRKAYHLGFGKNIHRTTLLRANERRDSRIYEEFAMYLIAQARQKNTLIDLPVEVPGEVYAFDSSMVDLCLRVFWWATYKRNSGAVKLHTLYDVKTHIPCMVHITAASVHDVRAMDEIPYEKDGFYIFDRGYNDFERLYRINRMEAFFVVRARDNLHFRRMYSTKTDRATGVISDQTGVFEVFRSRKRYPEKLRRISYIDRETGKRFVFLTNNFSLAATDIALLYKYRWSIELFFKWLKQHLKITSFWGRSENAVRIQVYCAVIAYCLVSIVASEMKSDRSTYEILQIVGISLLDKTPVKQLLTNTDYKNTKEPDCNLLLFN